MAEFALPKKQQDHQGAAPRAPVKASDRKRMKAFKVYRYDPDSGQNPRYDTFEVNLTSAGRWCSTR